MISKIHSTKSERIKNRLRVEYKTKDREVKRRAREDKRVWLDRMGDEIEKYAENGSNQRTVSNGQKNHKQ